MTYKILCFGGLAEAIGGSEFSWDHKPNMSVQNLFKSMFENKTDIYNTWKDITLFAVNQKHVNKNYILKDADEVAFMPPMSGG